VGVVAVVDVIPMSPNTASTMRAGTAKSPAIGDTLLGATAEVLTAVNLDVASAGSTVVVAEPARAATGGVIAATFTGPPGCIGFSSRAVFADVRVERIGAVGAAGLERRRSEATGDATSTAD
jgi:hypothetical protein